MFYRCLKFIFVFAALPEVFKTLERDDSGKIELNMQQVCRNITKAAGFSALLIRAASCIMLFFIAVAVPGNLLALTATQQGPLSDVSTEKDQLINREFLYFWFTFHTVYQMLKSLWAILWLTCITCHVSWFFCKYFCSVGKNLVVLVGILLFISYNFCQAIKTC